MRAFIHVTDLVHGVTVDTSAITLEPIMAGFLTVPTVEALVPGSEILVVVRATVVTVLP